MRDSPARARVGLGGSRWCCWAATVSLLVRGSRSGGGGSSACPGQMGLSIAELKERYLPGGGSGSYEVAAARVGQRAAGPEGSVVVEAALPATMCQQLAELATPLLLPAAQKRDSVDGGPEFQVDLLEPTSTGILARLWPAIAHDTLPIMRVLTGGGSRSDDPWNSDHRSPFPLPSWNTTDYGGVRISDMFVRRYYRPPRDELARGGVTAATAREKSRWRLAQHKDAAEVSISVELSQPTQYEGGLYLGKRLRYDKGAGGGSGVWTQAQTLPPMTQGSAVVHWGNVTHGVSVKAGERWSLIIFWFHSCAAQTAYFGLQAQPPPPLVTSMLSSAGRWVRGALSMPLSWWRAESFEKWSDSATAGEYRRGDRPLEL